MIITVLVWRITLNFNPPYDAAGWVVGNFIHVRFDDVTETFSVQLRDASTPGAGTLIASPVSGPGLFFTDGGVAQNLTPAPWYSYCDGVDLKGITPQNSFPYAYLGVTLNAAQCQVAPVCDLQILDAYTVTPASAPGEPDGSIQVSATSSNGTPHFSLAEGFDYATGTAIGFFGSLVPGTYTVYAKDPLGCTDSIEITVEVTTVYGPRYRMEFDKFRKGNLIPNAKGRVDILERAYVGDVEEVCGGETPFYLRVNKDLTDRYDCCIFSEAEIQLMTRTEGKFIDLFLGDDRKYQVRYYEYEGGIFNLKWIGFVIPQLYSEPILAPPFYTTVKCSDNLAIFQNDDFYDINGNPIRDVSSVLTLLVQQLEKTGLTINIRSCVDLFENSMDVTDDDDPLPQSFVDTTIFYSDKKVPDKTIDVIQKLLKPYGARIFQALGIWWIMRLEKSAGLIQYRDFDYQGTFIESGDIDPEMTLGKNQDGNPKWRDRAQRYQLTENAGEINIKHTLGYDGNLIDSGSFEEEYLKEIGGGYLFFENWAISLGQPGISYGLEQVDNGDSKGALYVDMSEASGPGAAGNDLYQSDTEVYSRKFRVVNTGQITLKFQYMVLPDINMPFVRLAYRVKITSPDLATVYYLIAFNGNAAFVDGTTDIDDWNNTGFKNEIHVTQYGSFQTYERSFTLPVNLDGWDMEVSLFFHNGYGVRIQDDNNFGDLKALATSNRLQGIRRLYYYDNVNQVIHDYLLTPSPATESESFPDLIEPTDYNGTTKTSRWRRQNSIHTGPNQIFVNKFLIDNLSVSTKIFVFSPVTALITPPDELNYKNVITLLNYNKISEEVFIGDLPDIENAQLIYDGYFRLEDGTPTASWTRKGDGEDKAILHILLEDRTAQQSNSLRNMTGVIDSVAFISYANSIRDLNDNRVYVWNGYEYDAKRCMYPANLIELVTGEDGSPPPDTFEFTTEFSTEYNA